MMSPDLSAILISSKSQTYWSSRALDEVLQPCINFATAFTFPIKPAIIILIDFYHGAIYHVMVQVYAKYITIFH